MMSSRPDRGPAPEFAVRFAQDTRDLAAAQRLRYRVFVSEMGAVGGMVDHQNALERDNYDDHAAHLLLLDTSRERDDQVVGTYRLMTRAMADAAGQFYSADEYDLTPLLQSGRNLLELGRSCLHLRYRGGAGLIHLWRALADYASAEGIDLVFGVASLPGADVATHAQALSLLHHRHLAPSSLRVTAIGDQAHKMDLIAPEELDRVAAVRSIPSLIKGYLRLGGTVGDGAFVDKAFNTTDVCLILEKAALNAMNRAHYLQERRNG